MLHRWIIKFETGLELLLDGFLSDMCSSYQRQLLCTIGSNIITFFYILYYYYCYYYCMIIILLDIY